MVDDEDYGELIKYKWYAQRVSLGSTYYAFKALPREKMTQRKIGMHSFVFAVEKGTMIDHIDGNGLNNQKSNLRIATHAQNMRNCKGHDKSTSKFKGVSKYRNTNIWVAQIYCNGEKQHLGYFKNEIDAAKKYDSKAKELFADFARLNFPSCGRDLRKDVER